MLKNMTHESLSKLFAQLIQIENMTDAEVSLSKYVLAER